MGFFSWKTQDTDKSIANIYSNRDVFPVKMLDDKGNVWHETEYEGYGDFGGMDYYALLAEMNGYPSDRDIGIDLRFGHMKIEGELKYPKLVEESCTLSYSELSEKPEECEYQGFFYE